MTPEQGGKENTFTYFVTLLFFVIFGVLLL